MSLGEFTNKNGGCVSFESGKEEVKSFAEPVGGFVDNNGDSLTN